MAAVGLIALQASSAHAVPVATTTFNWSYSEVGHPDSYVTGQGTFDAMLVDGRYHVDIIHGTANGSEITGLNAIFPSDVPGMGLNPPDQTFVMVAPHFTFDGLSFNAGSQEFNFYSSTSGLCGVPADCLFWQPVSVSQVFAAEASSDNNALIEFNVTLAQTPLPATWFMMLGGLAMLGFATYRRKSLVLAKAV